MAGGELNTRSLIWFGGSHFGRTVVWVAADLYAFYALTTVTKLAAETAGAIFLATMLFSAACDLVVGWILDRRGVPHTRLLVAAAVVSCASFAASLMLTAPVLAVLSALLFRLTYAIYDVPHNALVKRLSSAATPTVTVSLVRFLTGAAASFTLAGLAGALVREKGEGLVALALVVAMLGGVTMALYAPIMARRAKEEPPAAKTDAGTGGFVAGYPVLGLLAVALLGAVLGGLLTKALVFVGELDLGGAAWAGRALGILTIGRLAAAPLWALAARRWAVLPLTAVAFAVVTLGGGLLAAAPGSRLVLDIGVCLLGAGFGGVTVYSWALLPSLSSVIGARLGRDLIHTAVATYTALNKVALGLSGLVMGALLSSRTTIDAPLPLAQALGLVLVLGASVCVVLLSLRTVRASGTVATVADGVTTRLPKRGRAHG